MGGLRIFEDQLPVAGRLVGHVADGELPASLRRHALRCTELQTRDFGRADWFPTWFLKTYLHHVPLPGELTIARHRQHIEKREAQKFSSRRRQRSDGPSDGRWRGNNAARK